MTVSPVENFPIREQHIPHNRKQGGNMCTGVRVALFIFLASMCGGTFAAPMDGTGAGNPERSPDSSQLEGMVPDQSGTNEELRVPTIREKSVASGLYMFGQFTYHFNNGAANITLDQINNDSYTVTTGTLRLSLWATTYQPVRGVAITGYRLVDFTTLNPLQPRTHYSNVQRSAPYTSPPDGNYWLVLVLYEYNPANCPTNADGYCLEDTFISYSTLAWGPGLPTYNYSDLWWNPNESGWGVVVQHHTTNIAFIAWYTYDTLGNPKWYVASSCPMIGDACFGQLYETNGPPFGPTFDPAAVAVRNVGTISFSFTDRNNGFMSYNVRGSTAVKAITRQSF